ncbi:MAG: hypothetical protein WC749_05735 [Dehalococcoidia bacterium]
MPRSKNPDKTRLDKLEAMLKEMAGSVQTLTESMKAPAAVSAVAAGPSPMEQIQKIQEPGEYNLSSTRDLKTGKRLTSAFASGQMVRVSEKSPKYPLLMKAMEGAPLPPGEVIRLLFCDEHKKYLVNIPGIGDDAYKEEELVRA